MAEITHLSYRLRLAYILASSLTYFFVAKYPIDYKSESLIYYSESTSDSSDVYDLAESRLSPYVVLSDPESAPRSLTSIILKDAINSFNNEQRRLHGLGVLLCEVARWEPIVIDAAAVAENNPINDRDHWRSLALRARVLSIDLVRCSTSGYQKVVNSCLNYVPHGEEAKEQIGEWLERNVVVPLKKEVDGLNPEFNLF